MPNNAFEADARTGRATYRDTMARRSTRTLGNRRTPAPTTYDPSFRLL
jgi:hypothetical protein